MAIAVEPSVELVDLLKSLVLPEGFSISQLGVYCDPLDTTYKVAYFPVVIDAKKFNDAVLKMIDIVSSLIYNAFARSSIEEHPCPLWRTVKEHQSVQADEEWICLV
jgi:hypothetical protein